MITSINRSALLSHSAEQLFALVADIERYPQFLDGCVDARIFERDGSIVTAQLNLSRAGFGHSFITRNTLHPYERIELNLVDGPFEHFEGYWVFQALAPEACKVVLSLKFKLRNGLMHKMAGHLFDKVSCDLVDAVVRRARELYAG